MDRLQISPKNESNDLLEDITNLLNQFNNKTSKNFVSLTSSNNISVATTTNPTPTLNRFVATIGDLVSRPTVTETRNHPNAEVFVQELGEQDTKFSSQREISEEERELFALVPKKITKFEKKGKRIKADVSNETISLSSHEFTPASLSLEEAKLEKILQDAMKD